MPRITIAGLTQPYLPALAETAGPWRQAWKTNVTEYCYWPVGPWHVSRKYDPEMAVPGMQLHLDASERTERACHFG